MGGLLRLYNTLSQELPMRNDEILTKKIEDTLWAAALITINVPVIVIDHEKREIRENGIQQKEVLMFFHRCPVCLINTDFIKTDVTNEGIFVGILYWQRMCPECGKVFNISHPSPHYIEQGVVCQWDNKRL